MIAKSLSTQVFAGSVGKIKDITPQLSAACLVLLGMMNVVNAISIFRFNHVALINNSFSRQFIERTHEFTFLVGILLIIVAHGLAHKRQRALQLAIVLLLWEYLLNIRSGHHIAEAAISGSLIIWLIAQSKSFGVPSPAPSGKRLARALGLAVAYYVYALLGFLLLNRVVTPRPTVAAIFIEPLRMALGLPYFRYHALPSIWFAHSLLGIGACLVVFAALHALRPTFPHIRRNAADLVTAKRIIQQYAQDSLSYFALQDDRVFFFAKGMDACIAYRIVRGVAVVGGEPIGRPDAIPLMVADFLAMLDAWGLTVCFVGVTATYIPLFATHQLKALKLGEEATIDLPTFAAANLNRKVRRAVRHTQDVGIHLEVYTCQHLPLARYNELVGIHKQWLAMKGKKEYGYSMALGRMPQPGWDDDYLFILGCKDDHVLGYLGFIPVYKNAGWSLDAMTRTPDSPNGLMEFLIINSAEYLQREKASAMSLNFATFVQTTTTPTSFLQTMQVWLYDHLSTRYQMKSLYSFNMKFQPEWRDRYIIFKTSRSLPLVTLAIIECERLASLPFSW